jgi:hypothetical protein
MIPPAIRWREHALRGTWLYRALRFLGRLRHKGKARRVRKIALEMAKRVYRRLPAVQRETRQMAVVFGCHRSGTTILMDCLDLDIRTKSFGELGLTGPNPMPPEKLYPDAHGNRRLPAHEIWAIAKHERSPLVIAKLLRESQHASRILDSLPGARAVWIYRNYRDVAMSHLTHWSDTLCARKIRPIYDGATNEHWASEEASDKTRAIIREFYKPDMMPGDAGALLWYSRNVLFFEQGLDTDQRVWLVRYEDFARMPQREFEKILRFLDYSYPGDHVVRDVHTRAIGRGAALEIAPAIRDICDRLLKRLDDARSLRLEDPTLATRRAMETVPPAKCVSGC